MSLSNWILPAGKPRPPMVHAYRLHFSLKTKTRLRFRVTADERYILFLDGERIGCGPERGDANNWFCEHHDLPLKAGKHSLVAQVWALGKKGPLAQVTVKPGFFLEAEGRHAAQFSTGQAPWEVLPLGGYRFKNLRGRLPKYYAIGADLEIDGRSFHWGFECGLGQGWKLAPIGDKATGMSLWGENYSGRLLKEPMLAPMLDRPLPPGLVRHGDNSAAWQDFLTGSQALTIPPNQKRCVVIDLQDYYCAYPSLTVSGGAGSRVTLRWAEALYLDPEGKEKGHRDEVEGRYFIGLGDRFLPDGGKNRRFETLWWRAGRYLQLEIKTSARPLKIEALTLRETRYPLESEVHFQADDPRWKPLCDIAVRSLQMCAHETYFDCPYYEQLMYTGDTRVMMLCQYVISRDVQLPRKAIAMFDASRDVSGLTASRYPARSRQVIPSFSLWWVATVYDYALWRGDREFIRARLPGVRGVLETWLAHQREDGLVEKPPGWSFQDWVPEWERGAPPGGETSVSSSFNWQLVLALNFAAELEQWAGEKELAARAKRRAKQIARATTAAFWNAERHLFADDPGHRHYSEHAQCMAILSGEPVARGLASSLVKAKGLAKAGIFFSHYVLEACRRPELSTAWYERLEPWLALPGQGFKTTPEYWQSSRSDCHAWSAHPIYHFATGLLGIRPVGLGFSSVSMAPMPGPLRQISGGVIHPNGIIRAELIRDGQSLRAEIELPGDLAGTLHWQGRRYPLKPGKQVIQTSRNPG